MAFEFRLPPDLTLRLTPENTTLARDVAFASGVHSMDPTELCSVIESLANTQGEVTKPHLLALFSSRPQNVIECISECYDALQRRGHAPMDELMTALSILCSCTKSDKLAAAFEVFDPQGRGSLGRVALVRMMRAFMVGIWSFAGVPVSAQIAETAAWFADAICKEVASTRVSFEDFGEFYNVAGFHVMSWVETLDLTKWPDEATDENEEPTVSFEVPIADEKTCRVVFSREDVSTLQALVTRTGLSELDAQVVCRLLLDCSSDGVLDESVSRTWCERQLLPAGVLDDDERSTYMRLLSSLPTRSTATAAGRSTPPSSRTASACSARARRAPSSRPRGSCSTTTAMASSRAADVAVFAVVSHYPDGRVRGGDRRRAEHSARCRGRGRDLAEHAHLHASGDQHNRLQFLRGLVRGRRVGCWRTRARAEPIFTNLSAPSAGIRTVATRRLVA